MKKSRIILVVLLAALSAIVKAEKLPIYYKAKDSAPIAAQDEAALRKIAESIGVAYEKFQRRRHGVYRVNELGLIQRYVEEEQNSDFRNLDYMGAGLGSFIYRTNSNGRIWALGIGESEFSDLQVLKTLSKLQYFSCYSCKIEKINLTNFNSIRMLELKANPLTSSVNLSGVDNLKYLSLNNIKPEVMKNFPKLEGLIYLKIKHSYLNKFDWLENMPNLIDLKYSPKYGSNDLIKNISPISKLKHLRSLEIESLKSITDIKPLFHLKKLEYLGLYGMDVSSLEGISSLKNLLSLRLFKTKLSSTKGLKNLKNLKDIDIDSSYLSKLEDLTGLDSLQEVSFEGNRLTSMKDLSHLKTVHELRLADNLIDKIDGLEGMDCLDYLDLTNNKIKKFENLDVLPRLEYVDLRGNKIPEVNGWEKLKHIVYIHLDEEPIVDKSKGYTRLFRYYPNKEMDHHMRYNRHRHRSGEKFRCKGSMPRI